MNIYIKLEQNLNIIYPNNENATYTSVLNYSDDLSKPFQRWFRYKEGYSVELVDKILDENKLNRGIILDPFSGSGTTLLASKNRGIKSIGFEINPFTHMLSTLKVHNYTQQEINEFESNIDNVLDISQNIANLPNRDMMKNVFSDKIKKEFLSIKYNIINLDVSKNIKNLFLLGWVSQIELFSNYRKSGNGLKKRNAKSKYEDKHSVYSELIKLYNFMLIDIKQNNNNNNSSKVIMDSCLNLDNYIDNESIDGVIFSPPYANCFDYTEIYKLELWFGDFVKTTSDLKRLRNISLRSHLNSNLNEENIIESKYLNEILTTLSSKQLWDKRIPKMLKLYFHDMFKLLYKLKKIMKKDAFCNIIVSNSAYGGIVIPTDLLIANFAKNIGYIVEKIEIDRYIITSSQQYKDTLNYKKYLRESVICLRKK